MADLDLKELGLREINSKLHSLPSDTNERHWVINHPMGQHAIACGLDAPLDVSINGHVGFYCAGMNKEAEVTVHGHAGVGVAENMMSGLVRVKGNASQSAGATGHGGLLVVEGDASSRCGISMKGIDIVVGGSVGHMSAFMAQSGHLVVCGDAGEALGGFDLRGQAVRARQCREPRCRLHRKGNAGRTSGDAHRASGACGHRCRSEGFPAIWLGAQAVQF